MMYYIDRPATWKAPNKKCEEAIAFAEQFKNCLVADNIARDALVEELRQKVEELNHAYPRQFKLAFSDYFDAVYKPEMEFGGQFFSDSWDERQWSLFYNLMAECLQLYFEAQAGHWGVGGSGLIEAPSRNHLKKGGKA